MKRKSLILGLIVSLVVTTGGIANAESMNKKSLEVKEASKGRINYSDGKISDDEKLKLLTGTLTEEAFSDKFSKLKKETETNEKDKYSKKDKYGKNETNTATTFAMTVSSTHKMLSNSFYFLTDEPYYGTYRYWYGGDQMWYDDKSYIESTACGPVSIANLLAYDAKYYGRRSLYSGSSWTKSKFQDFQTEIWNYIKGPTLPSEYVGTYRRMAEKNGGYYYKTNFIYDVIDPYSQAFRDLKAAIVTAIDSNCPVGLLFGGNYNASKYSWDYGRPDLAMHWVTVTGYNPYDPEEITISTWGGQEVVDLWYLIRTKGWIDMVYFTW